MINNKINRIFLKKIKYILMNDNKNKNIILYLFFFRTKRIN